MTHWKETGILTCLLSYSFSYCSVHPLVPIARCVSTKIIFPFYLISDCLFVLLSRLFHFSVVLISNFTICISESISNAFFPIWIYVNPVVEFFNSSNTLITIVSLSQLRINYQHMIIHLIFSAFNCLLMLHSTLSILFTVLFSM